jgi:hypothetical protein
LSSEYKALSSMPHVQASSMTDCTAVELVWQRLESLV